MDSRLFQILLVVTCLLVAALMVAVGCVLALGLVPRLLDMVLLFWALAFG